MDVTTRDITIKTPDKKWTGDVNDVMPGSAEDLGDLKEKSVSWDSSLAEVSRFLLGSTKCAVRLLKKFCLCLLMTKNLKLKKVNKSFVPEPISGFSNSYMRMNICERFPYLYDYVYFTYSYLAM